MSTRKTCVGVTLCLFSVLSLSAGNVNRYDDRAAFEADTASRSVVDFDTVRNGCASLPGADGLTVNGINFAGGVSRGVSSGPCSPPLQTWKGYVLGTRLLIRQDVPAMAFMTATLPAGVMAVGFDTGINSDPVTSRIQVTVVTSDQQEQTFTLAGKGTGNGGSRKVEPVFVAFSSSRSISAIRFNIPDIIDSNLVLDNFTIALSAKRLYGFLVNSWQTKTNSDVNGTAVLGMVNIDHTGNVTGTYTLVKGATAMQPTQTVTGTSNGTYSTNPDGTGAMTLTLDIGLSFTFSTVVTGGGQELQLVATNSAGADLGGTVLSGLGRAASFARPQGSYGFRLDDSPAPAGTLGVASFDGAGNVTLTFTSVGVPDSGGQPPVMNGTLTGTYSFNTDGSGVIDLTPSAGGKFAVVVTDGGSGLLLLLTNGTGNNVSLGTARLQ